VVAVQEVVVPMKVVQMKLLQEVVGHQQTHIDLIVLRELLVSIILVMVADLEDVVVESVKHLVVQEVEPAIKVVLVDQTLLIQY
jgi:hypothetical protein